MTGEIKLFRQVPSYDRLSDEQKQEFKKALFLSKGEVNNDAGGMLAMLGLSGEDIAKYGTGWKSETGVDMQKFLSTSRNKQSMNKRERATRKLLVQQAMRIPDLFDTIRGRVLVAKYGEEVKDEFCNKSGKCPLSVVSPNGLYGKMLDSVEFVDGMVTGSTFERIEYSVKRDLDVEFSGVKALKLEFLEHIKAITIARAKSKGVDLWKIFESNVDSKGWYRLEQHPEFREDFWTFIKQDFEAIANAPEDIARKLRLREEEKAGGIQTIATLLSRRFTTFYNVSSRDYGASSNALFNSLYIKAMYAAMDEMGVGIGSSSQLHIGSRGKLHTNIKKVTKKVITLNEKYQKMLKNKSNTIEPAILRQTIVGMFNEYADRNFLRFRMFIREDRPALTLASLKPAEKLKKATTTRTSKRSTGPKRVVTDDEGHKFVEY